MEVLKHGEVYEEDLKARTVTCECGCEYRFEVSDINHREISASWNPIFREERFIYEHSVICPECGKEKDVTEYLKSKMRKN